MSGEVFTPGVFRTLKASYFRNALDLVDQYHHDAEMNGYTFDRYAEEQVVDMFSQALMTAGEHYLSRPMELPFIPSWSLVLDTPCPTSSAASPTQSTPTMRANRRGWR